MADPVTSKAPEEPSRERTAAIVPDVGVPALTIISVCLSSVGKSLCGRRPCVPHGYVSSSSPYASLQV